jgi:CRP-like cAMP-binding protein
MGLLLHEAGGSMEREQLLRAFPYLRSVDPDDAGRLQATRVERAAGEPFFLQGDPGDAVYGVLTGRVKIAKQSPTGRELILDVLGTGEPISVIPVVRRLPMPASAIAVEPAACLRIAGPVFLEVMGKHPQVILRVLEAVSQRLMEANASRLTLATDPVEARLAGALLRMGEKFGVSHAGETVFTQRFTRQSLAELAGTTVESTIRVMSRWTRDGLVRTQNGRITVVDPARLQQLAEEPSP